MTDAPDTTLPEQAAHFAAMSNRDALAALKLESERDALRSRCETLERENAEERAMGNGWHKRWKASEAARDEAVRALEQAAERYTVFRQLLIDTMDTSPSTEGAQEFITRLTDAMEAAADKLELPTPNNETLP